MAAAVQWATFDGEHDEEEKLSFSDLVDLHVKKAGPDAAKHEKKSPGAEAAGDDFEFIGMMSKADMCAADDVFFEGQILPLRPSVSCSESMDRLSSAAASLLFQSSRSVSSSSSTSSSSCMSRSHSSNSCEAPRVSVSNNFYAHPSPSPQVRRPAASINAGRRSTGSPPPGWGLFRLGVVKAPEITELQDLKSRKLPIRRQCRSNNNQEITKQDGGVLRFLGRKLGCHWDEDTAAASEVLIVKKKKKKKKKKKEEVRLRRGDSMPRSTRISEWLEQLSMAKA